MPDQPNQPNLFDLEDPDGNTPGQGGFRAPEPKRKARTRPPAPPRGGDLDAIAARVAEARTEWDRRIAEARARADQRGAAAMDGAMATLEQLTASHDPQTAAAVFNETMRRARDGE